MYISEFSSLVFNKEDYVYDQKAYDITQVFGTDDKIMVCIFNLTSTYTANYCESINVVVSKYNENTETFNQILDCNFDTNYPQSTTQPRPFIKCTPNGSYWVTNLRDLILSETGYITKEELYGLYRVRFCDTENTPDYYTEAMFEIRSEEELKETFEIKYTNNRNVYDTVFYFKNSTTNTYENIYYSFRFKGSIVKKDTKYGIAAVVGADQQNYSHLLSGFKKDTYTLCMGDNFGVPNGYARIFRNALSCNETYLNGVRFAISDEQDVERESIGDIYPYYRFTATINSDFDIVKEFSQFKLQVLGTNNKRLALTNNNYSLYLGYNKLETNEFNYN